MSFHELIAIVAARPLRPKPLVDLQARLDKLANQELARGDLVDTARNLPWRNA